MCIWLIFISKTKKRFPIFITLLSSLQPLKMLGFIKNLAGDFTKSCYIRYFAISMSVLYRIFFTFKQTGWISILLIKHSINIITKTFYVSYNHFGNDTNRFYFNLIHVFISSLDPSMES